MTRWFAYIRSVLVTGASRNGLPTPGKVDIDIVIDMLFFLSCVIRWPERSLAWLSGRLAGADDPAVSSRTKDPGQFSIVSAMRRVSHSASTGDPSQSDVSRTICPSASSSSAVTPRGTGSRLLVHS